MKIFSKKVGNIYKLLFLFYCFLLLCSCSTAVPPKRYIVKTDRMPSAVNISKSSAKTSILVYSTTNNSLYDTNKMIYIMPNSQLGYYAHNEWAVPPAIMVNKEIIKTIQQTNLYKNILAAPFSGPVNLRLATQLIDFQQDWLNNGESFFHITLAVQLINGQNNQIIASKVFTAKTPVFLKTPEGGVHAANIGLTQILSQLNFFLKKHS